MGADLSKDLSALGLPNSCERVTQSTVNPLPLSDFGVVFSSARAQIVAVWSGWGVPSVPGASCESHLELSEQEEEEEEEVLGLLQGCRRCFCTGVRTEGAQAGGVWARESPWGLAPAEPLQHTQLLVRICG